MVISNLVMRSVAASVVSLIGFSTLFSAAPSLAAGITNGGFEDPVNGFNGWEVKGNTKIETSAFGSGPTEGSQQALTLTAKPAVAASEIESFLGLATGSLNGIANKNVQNGSAIKQTFSATAGQKLTFDWNFLTDEGRTGQAGVDYTDFGFVSLGIVSELADTKFSTFSLSDADFRAETGFNTFEYIIQTSGEYILGVGVANVNDTKVHSALLVDNVKLASVPEPGSMLGILAVGAFGATSLLKRKQQQKATAKA
ncbi:PEP-CTERM sorting domain-containing protein [Mastigocladopsis repens]|uniref:PEP-CTERM sorting domain-containing protein n=1 Tax=Mastigocladopsis repens TaxID=221287 RepID=UPI000318FF36|nr:PEP-CTERM sorting domain-containing protein [Mastigocladopsis repens]